MRKKLFAVVMVTKRCSQNYKLTFKINLMNYVDPVALILDVILWIDGNFRDVLGSEQFLQGNVVD